jgi:hypothetical protein
VKKKLTAFIAVLAIALFGFSLGAPIAEAQAPPSATNALQTVQTYGGLRSGDLPTFVATIIRWLLGLIGVVLVAMFVYGGVMYATSAGNDERVETGKKIMIYAVIGTAIIVVAFIASDYIIRALLADPTTGSQL